MRRITIYTLFAIVLASVAVIAWGIGIKSILGDDTPDLSSDNFLVVAPYVQNMTPNSVTIMWQTNKPSTANIMVSGDGKGENRSISSERRQHEVEVTDLKPDTEYFYTVTFNKNEAGKSLEKQGRFRTFPEKPRPIRFLVYGDTRTNPGDHKLVADAMATEENVDFVMHSGDLVADGRDFASWSKEFFSPAAELIRRVPVFPVLGNHEKNSNYYFQQFALPGGERYYSFDVGDVHIVALDSCTDFDERSKQYGWLISDLERARDAKWTFVFMHHPTYTSGNHGKVDSRGIPTEAPIRTAQEVMPALAMKYNINAIFAGHDHSYEHSERDGVSYIVAGGGGAPLRGNPNAKHNRYTKNFESSLHYCVVDINGDKGSVVVKTPDGKVIDKFNL